MAEGIVKSVEELERLSQPPEHKTTAPMAMGVQWENVPISIYRYFNIDMATSDRDTVDKLKTIFEWAKNGAKNIGDVIWKISKLERELGAPHANEARHTKIFNWVKISGIIDSLRKQKKALKRG